VEVQAGAGLAVQRLGHEGGGLAAPVGDHAHHVLDEHDGVAHLEHRAHVRLDLALPGAADLVVVVAHRDAHLLEDLHGLAAQVVEAVHRRAAVVAPPRRMV
jgi:hypothetical protein